VFYIIGCAVGSFIMHLEEDILLPGEVQKPDISVPIVNWNSIYLYLKVIRPLSRLYGVSSTFTLSPGRIFI